MNGHNGSNGHGKPGIKGIRTHLMLSVTQRRRMSPGLNERGYYKNRPSYMRERKNYSNTNAAKESWHTKYDFKGPTWLLPAISAITRSITASIVWGLCGQHCQGEEGGPC